jgi:hypothetical protein
VHTIARTTETHLALSLLLLLDEVEDDNGSAVLAQHSVKMLGSNRSKWIASIDEDGWLDLGGDVLHTAAKTCCG